MYPRLELLRELLSEDGSIWVTIDDNEGHYLKVVMDEVFARSNFVADAFWQKTATRENRTDFSSVHDHVFVYAKQRSVWSEIRNPLTATEEQLSRFTNPDNDPRGAWASLPAHAKAEKGRRQAQFFSVTTPSGRTVDPPPGRCWLYTEPRFEEMIADNRIWFGENGNNVPRVKKFLSEVQAGLVPSTFWAYKEVGTNAQAKLEIVNLFPGDVPFSTPKPEALISRAIHIGTNPGDLVLDSFLGSGTTAAVAHKMGRRWIGVEMGDHADDAGAARLRTRALLRLLAHWPRLAWVGGGGFRFCRLGEPVFDGHGSIRPGVGFADLAQWIWYRETRQPLGQVPGSPLLGVHQGTAFYLLFNGILGDRRPDGGNVLTAPVLEALPAHDGPRVVFGEACRLHDSRLAALGVRFKQLPYQANG